MTKKAKKSNKQVLTLAEQMREKAVGVCKADIWYETVIWPNICAEATDGKFLKSMDIPRDIWPYIEYRLLSDGFVIIHNDKEFKWDTNYQIEVRW